MTTPPFPFHNPLGGTLWFHGSMVPQASFNQPDSPLPEVRYGAWESYLGPHFASRRETALEFTTKLDRQTPSEPRLFTCQLLLTRPLYVGSEIALDTLACADGVEAGLIASDFDDLYEALESLAPPQEQALAELIKANLQAQGYDAILYENLVETWQESTLVPFQAQIQVQVKAVESFPNARAL